MVLRYITADMPKLDRWAAGVLRELIMLQARADPDGGRHRLGQVDHAGGDDQPPQRERSDHIVTIEDPIEFLHTNKRSIVNQREVGLDTKSYERALRGVMRAAPDVILIGEIRDRESMQAAINLAGTGHLVLATLHANNCAETLDRIINMFPHRPAQAGDARPVAVPARGAGAAPGASARTTSASPRSR
jgi:twitching motility protein PilU